ncbi:MAG: phosphoglucosamine mutase [Desulfobacterota bacterium]|nr:phosphoglucosamine mutase [Thermodesulfobacteriota bacterium]MDW8001262.1 phosphoglucosamine mutase [Deltaproteobacteria bacterium]
MGQLFGTDGIRGEANRYPMDAETAFLVGQAVTHLFKKEGHKPRIIIGKDTRISGYMLESSLEAGITSMGGNPYLVGVLPTPAVAFLTQSMRADAGIVVSASHNPYEDNGIKIFGRDGFKLSDGQEEMIEDLVLQKKLASFLPKPKDMGQAFRLEDAHGRYIVFLKNTFPRELSMENLKVVLDTAHGAAYRVAPEVFFELGAETYVINNTPNGLNINDQCGSLYPEGLRKKVLETGADIGLAFDGDGDRLIAVDEKGNILTGDQVLIICGKTLKDENRLKNNLIVATVMSNFGFCKACNRYGINYHLTRVGDRYVLEDMLRLGSVLGGEESGHTIFLEHHTTGDGIITALQLISVMLKTNKRLSELSKLMEVYPQKIMNVEVREKRSLDTVPEVLCAVEKVKKELKDEGRVLVRYSGTQNLLRIMVEGPDMEKVEGYCHAIAEVAKKHLS